MKQWLVGSFFVFAYLFGPPAKAQFVEQQGQSQPGKVGSFFVQPLLGVVQSRMRLEGHPRFTKSRNPGEAFPLSWGGTMGYRTKQIAIQAGIIKHAVYSGYYFSTSTTGDGMRGYNRSLSVSYLQFPLWGTLTLWKPTKNWQLGLTAGGSLHRQGQSFGFLRQSIEELGSTTPTGGQIRIRSIVDKEYRQTFISAQLGLDLSYRLSNRFRASLVVQRLFSPPDIGVLKAQVTQEGDPTLYSIKAASSLNGMAMWFGLTYEINKF